MGTGIIHVRDARLDDSSEIPRRETVQKGSRPINHAMQRSGYIVRKRRIKNSAFSGDSAIWLALKRDNSHFAI